MNQADQVKVIYRSRQVLQQIDRLQGATDTHYINQELAILKESFEDILHILQLMDKPREA